MTPGRRLMLALFSIAFGLRILYAVVAGTTPSVNPTPITSEFVAAEIVADGIDWVSTPKFPQAPGYPVLLGFVFRVFGPSVWAAILLGAVLGAATVLVAFQTGNSRFGWPVGLASGLWLALYIHHMHYASLVLRDVLVALLLLVFCHLLSRPFVRMRGAVWTAIAYVALVHVDPQYLLWFPLAAIYLLAVSTHHRLLSFQYATLFAAAALALAVPWAARNAVVYGEALPVALETARYLPRLGGSGNPSAPPPTHRMGMRDAATNVHQMWRPVHFAEKAIGSESAATADGTFVDRSWSPRHNLISAVEYGLLLPLFVVGVVEAVRRRHRTGLLFAGVTAVYTFQRAAFGAGERARVPIEPLVIILAFFGASTLRRAMRGRRRNGEGRDAAPDHAGG